MHLLSAPVRLLNQPQVKEGVKNFAGTATCLFGLVEIYDVYQILRGRSRVAESDLHRSSTLQLAYKIAMICAKISLILSSCVSRPGVFIISLLVGCITSTSQLNSLFGSNTLFAINPWHPRHVVSIVAVILALPSNAFALYQGANWGYKKIQRYRYGVASQQNQRKLYTDTKAKIMALFNTLTSRPTLHSLNKLCRCFA